MKPVMLLVYDTRRALDEAEGVHGAQHPQEVQKVHHIRIVHLSSKSGEGVRFRRVFEPPELKRLQDQHSDMTLIYDTRKKLRKSTTCASYTCQWCTYIRGSYTSGLSRNGSNDHPNLFMQLVYDTRRVLVYDTRRALDETQRPGRV